MMEESAHPKNLIAQAMRESTLYPKAKKPKKLPTLSIDVNTRHMVMEIAESEKEGRIEDLVQGDFQLRTHDMGP